MSDARMHAGLARLDGRAVLRVALPLVALAVVVLIGFSLPALARARAVAVLERRLAVDAVIGDVLLKPGSVELRDLRLDGREGGMTISVRSARAATSPVRLALGGRPRHLTLSGVEVTLELEHPGLRRSLAEMRHAVARRRGHGPGAARTGRGRTIELQLEDGRVRSLGEEGERVLLDELDASVVLAGGRLRSTGGGRAERGGTLDWNLELAPRAGEAGGRVRFNDLSAALVLPLLPEVPWHRPQDATTSGEVWLERLEKDMLRVAGRASITGAGLADEAIAPHPIEGVAASFDGVARVVPDRRRLDIEHARLTIGGAALEVSGWLESRDDQVALELAAELPATPCTAAVHAIPASLLGELAAFSWNGTMAGRVALALDTARPEATEVSIRLSERCSFETIPPVADLARFRGTFLYRAPAPGGEAVMIKGPGSSSWVPLEQVSPFLVHAVLSHEDPAFFRHQGFAPWAIESALERDIAERRFAWGASTISMQLARNLFLEREKTLERKLREVLLTWWLESALTKREIIELYLNVIELGPGVYGIGPGASHYFDVEPAALTPAQAAFLATVLPNPRAYHRNLERGALSASTDAEMRSLLERMTGQGRIDRAALEYGLAELDAFRFGSGDGPRQDAIGRAAPLPWPAATDAWAPWRGPEADGTRDAGG